MTLPEIVSRFASQRGLILGDIMLDEYLVGECSRLSPEAPVPVLAVTGSRMTLGGAANTAANVRSLGGQAVLVGLVGDDTPGRHVHALARAAGIEFRAIAGGHQTVRKVRVLGQQQHLLRLDYEPAQTAAPPEAEVRRIVAEELPRVSFVVLSDYAKGLFTESLCRDVIRLAHDAGVPVIVDPRPQHATFYAGCDYLTPNWKEALGLAGLTEQAVTPGALDSVGATLARRFGASILLTLGARGMRLIGPDGGTLVDQPATAREVFDVSGAGDTVVAAFGLALASGGDPRTAVALATRAAGVVVGKLGTATVDPDELIGSGHDDPPARLVSRADLPALAARLRARHQRIATINGAFDLLHAGHLHILHEARSQADVLVVGLNSDRSVRANKGPDRPLVGEQDRAAMLLALRDVDFVHIFDEATPNAFLAALGPDVHVNGAEYGENCVEAETVRAAGGRLHLVGRLPGLSTTDVLARAKALAASQDRE